MTWRPRREYLVGHDVRMGVAHAPGRDAACQIVHRLIGERRDPAVEKRKVDMLPATRTRAFGKRGLNADRAVETGQDVDPGDADLLRLAAGIARQVHDPA